MNWLLSFGLILCMQFALWLVWAALHDAYGERWFLLRLFVFACMYCWIGDALL